MQAAELAQAAEELYALPPGEFRAARDERARQARSAGERELATAIGKLRRPTVSAWLVNRLARDAAGQVEDLLGLGAEPREAQSDLAGRRLRELSGYRREVLSALIQRARQLAGQSGQRVSEQTERELGGTLEAALADPDAAAAVRSRRLASALSYAGLGGIDLAEAVAVPQTLGSGSGPRPGGTRAGRAGTGQQAARPGRSGRPAAGGGAQRRHAGRAADTARRDLAEAEVAARDAQDALAEAEKRVATAADRHEAARVRVEDLERELAGAQSAQTRAARDAAQARRSRDAAARSVTTAQRRLARARERAG